MQYLRTRTVTEMIDKHPSAVTACLTIYQCLLTCFRKPQALPVCRTTLQAPLVSQRKPCRFPHGVFARIHERIARQSAPCLRFAVKRGPAALRFLTLKEVISECAIVSGVEILLNLGFPLLSEPQLCHVEPCVIPEQHHAAWLQQLCKRHKQKDECG